MFCRHYLWLSLLFVLFQSHVCLARSPGQDALDQGALLYQAEAFEHAARIFKQATEKDPGLLKAWENLGWAQYKLGRFDEAMRIWEIVLKVDPQHIDLLNAVGSTYMEQEQWPQAMAAFEESLSAQSEQRTIQLRLARGHEALKQWEHAIEKYRAMLRKQPSDLDVIQRLARVYQMAGKEADAISLLEANLRKIPELGDRLATLYAQGGDQYFQEKRYQEAIKRYQQASRLAPKDPRYLINLGWAHRYLQALELAAYYWKQALALGAGDENLLRHIGDVAFELNDLDAATHWYEKARRRGSISKSSYKHLGWAYWRRQHWDLCEKTWLQFEEIFQKDAEPPALLARLYMKTADYGKAIQAAERSLLIQAEQPVVQLLRAKALFNDSRYSAARSTAVKLVRQYPEHLGINVFWGELLMQYHDFDKGEEQWRRVLGLNSDSPKAQYYWIKSLYETGKQEVALAKARHLLTQSNSNVRLLRLLKRDALSRADQQAAIIWLEQEVEVEPDSLASWLELAGTYQRLRRYDEAHETLRHATTFHAHNPLLQLALAELNHAEKNYPEAFELFSTVAGRSPYNRRAYLGRLDSLVGMGKYPSALALLEENDPLLLDDYGLRLKRGKILSTSGQADAAISEYRQLSEPKADIRYIPALLYHGLAKHSRGVNLTVERFSDQMAALKAAGYTAITLRQFADMADGNMQIPEKPIIISFDDARIDSFALGDPELARHGMRAVMFVPTGRIHDDHPFFADWEMIRKYADTGRWEMQNHGHDAHDLIEIDADGKQGTFLSNFRWLRHEHRFENETEFRQRLEQDYRSSTRILEKELSGSRILGYSFPFSEAGQELIGTAQQAAVINQQLLGRHMPYGFIQDNRGYNRIRIGESGPCILRRFVVPIHWAGEELIQHLVGKHPIHIAEKNIAKTHYTEGRYGRARDAFIQLASAEQWINTDSLYYLAATDYQRENYHSATRYLASLQETTTQNTFEINERAERLNESLAWHVRPSAKLKFGYFDDANGRTNNWLSARLDYPMKQPLHLWLEPARVKFREIDLAPLHANELTLGTEWQVNDDLALQIKFRYRDFDDGADSVNGWLAMEYWLGDQRLSFSVADYDVDTVSAHAENIDVVASRFQYAQILNKNWTVNAKLALQGYSDDNKRYDSLIGATFRLSTHRDWKVGAELRYSDSEKQTEFYYTPGSLIVGQANLSYLHDFKDNLSFDAQFGAGIAHDELNGDRFTGGSKLGLNKLWDKRLRGEVELKHSRVPGYHSTQLWASLTYLF
ncbi:MAG: tetratricopeptide repeat protein [Gammaproteobacteria bacterium]|nr:tetratricopeptide repeat protein [Gammaproteobacteria bacterium]